MAPPTKRRSGFAALIGRPNVGKSTLLNRLAGEKIAIVSHKPQTTRNRIVGVVTRQEGQVAFVDTPGVHDLRGALNRYMVDLALSAASEVDVILLIIEAPEKPQREVTVDPDDRKVLSRLEDKKKPIVLVINKIDRAPRPLLLPLIDAYRQAFPWTEIVPISARTGDGVDELFGIVLSHLPEGEPLFDEDVLTDQAERQLAAEYIREQILRHARHEVPYSAAVVVDQFDESERSPKGPARPGGLGGLVRIMATINVERESQKGILIGKRGQMLKLIGTDSRKAIERLLGTHVYLDLRVRVEPHWSERREGLKKLGYE
jgi:GTP-binding protein Era